MLGYPALWVDLFDNLTSRAKEFTFKGIRPVLEGFVVTMHEGACETGSDVLFAQARVHCDNKPRQIGL